MLASPSVAMDGLAITAGSESTPADSTGCSRYASLRIISHFIPLNYAVSPVSGASTQSPGEVIPCAVEVLEVNPEAGNETIGHPLGWKPGCMNGVRSTGGCGKRAFPDKVSAGEDGEEESEEESDDDGVDIRLREYKLQRITADGDNALDQFLRVATGEALMKTLSNYNTRVKCSCYSCHAAGMQ
jgi:hypothetical protein